jgi:3-oxo-5-alpha-steroid 4-dehydrogenase 1
MTTAAFSLFMIVMSFLAIIVFISLYFVDAGYGMLFNGKWGKALSNKVAWICMEAPVFIVMLLLWITSTRRFETGALVIFLLFEFHYFRRSFVFPLRMKGNSRMPSGIMAMGILFNLLNGFMQGEWLFHLAPEERYTADWLTTPPFIIGTIVFLTGMLINWQSDNIVRNLRKPGDTNHYLPEKGLFAYVTSANYFGEIVEWIGFAILTWSWSGAVFAWWTAANLVPRANTLYHKYQTMFGAEQMGKRKRIFPFIY